METPDYLILCTHYLSGTCKYENCNKLHPSDISQAKSELALKNPSKDKSRRQNITLCKREDQHDIIKCPDLHICSSNPNIEPLYIDNLVKSIVVDYNKKLSRYAQKIKDESNIAKFTSMRRELELIVEQLQEISKVLQ